MGQYSIAGIEIGTTVISQITDSTIEEGLEEIITSSSGNLDDSYTAVAKHAPTIKFSTTAVKAVLDLADINGLLFDEAAVATSGVTVWLRERALGGGFSPDGSAKHIKLFIGKGMVVPTNIEGGISKDATIQVEIIPMRSTLTAPADEAIVVTDETAFPAAYYAATDADHYTIGSVWINSKVIDFVQTMTIAFGINVDRLFSPGSIQPTWLGITSRKVTMSCQGSNVEHIGDATGMLDAGTQGVALTGITRFFLQKRVPGAGLVAPGSAAHISFQVDNGRVTMDNVGGGHGEHAKATFKITPIKPNPESVTEIVIVNTLDTIDIL